MTAFNTQIQSVLEHYELRMLEEQFRMQQLSPEEGMAKRDDFLLPVGKAGAEFIHSMILAANAQKVLEIGTSYGYSTLWLADAVTHTNGKVTTIEINVEKSNYAEHQMQKAQLNDYIDFVSSDVLQYLATDHQPYDLVFIDVWKELYVPSIKLLIDQLPVGAYIIADNIIHPSHHKEDAEAYREYIHSTQQFESVLLPIGSGLEVSRKIK